LYLSKLVSSQAAPAGRRLSLAIPLCLFGLVLVSFWWYARQTARPVHRLSTQEMGKELAKRKQAFARSSLILGLVSISGVLINPTLFVFAPLTPAQQSATALTLTLLVGGGMGMVWNYRSIQRLKQQLRQRPNDQSTPAQKERDDG
jgi:hypothetical protein